MATRTDIVPPTYYVFAGEDRTLTFTVVDEDSAAVDITGWTLSMDIGDGTVTNAGSISDATAGILTVTLSAANTTTLSGTKLQYRLRRTDSGSNTVLAHGVIKVLSNTQDQ